MKKGWMKLLRRMRLTMKNGAWDNSDIQERLPCELIFLVQQEHAMVSFLSPTSDPNVLMHVF